MKQVLTLAVFSILLMVNQLPAQPYIYGMDKIPEPDSLSQAERHNVWFAFRIDLRNGSFDTLDSHLPIGNLYEDVDQTRLFFVSGDRFRSGDISVADVNSPTVRTRIFSSKLDFTDMYDLPKMNRIWFRGIDPRAEKSPFFTYVFDRTTLQVIDSSTVKLGKFFFSRDQNQVYKTIFDKSGIYFDVFSTTTLQKISRKQCGTIGPFKYGPSFCDGENGYAVVGYQTIGFKELGKSGFPTQKFVTCDVDAGTVLSIIPFPYRADDGVRLFADGKRVIIEEIPWQDGPKRSGRYWIYETETGKLLQRLYLPPNGDLLTFENYPDMIYYYLENENRSINIDLTKLTSITSISPATVYVGSTSFTLTVSGKNFISGSAIGWNGTTKTTTFVADSILQASIPASDIAVVDSPLITVKNPDNSESNSIRFYVLKQPAVLEMIDSLRVKLQQCLNQNLIGDKNFVNELDNGLENARKHLVKGDSTKCAKEIE